MSDTQAPSLASTMSLLRRCNAADAVRQAADRLDDALRPLDQTAVLAGWGGGWMEFGVARTARAMADAIRSGRMPPAAARGIVEVVERDCARLAAIVIASWLVWVAGGDVRRAA